MYQKSKLSNQATLVLAPQHQTKAATVLVILPVGSRYESTKLNGVSHFIEHLLFKGTKKRPTTLDISKELDSIGAEYNAFTAKDHTGYYIKLAANRIELAFDILSDMLFNSVIDKTEMDKERGVVVEEINMYEDNPLIQIESIFEQVLFPAHPLGQLISGPRSVIKKITRSELVGYKNKFYYPANMTIAVAGSFNNDKVKKLAKKYFGVKAKSGKAPAYKKVKISQTKPRVIVQHKPTAQVQIALGFRAYPIGDPRLRALNLLGIVLGGNMSSRLFVTVREQYGLAYSIHASADGYQDTGVFSVQAGLDKNRVNKAITLILEELRKVRDNGITERELKDAKQYLRGKLVLALEDSEHVAGWYARQQALTNKIETPDQRLKKLDAVKLSDIAKVAKEIIKPNQLNLAVIGPFNDKVRFAKLLKM